MPGPPAGSTRSPARAAPSAATRTGESTGRPLRTRASKSSPATADSSTSRRNRARLILGVGVAAVVVLPVVAALVGALSRPWFPVSDWAAIEQDIARVGGADTPLIGARSRWGWHHPLPWFSWLLSVPYRLVGSEHGTLFGTVMLSAASLTAAAVLVVRVGGALLAGCFAICTSVLVYSLGIGFLADPWNAYIAFLPWMLAVVLAWVTALGRRWALPWLVAVGSLVVGSHLGYAPFVAAIVLVAVIGLTRSYRGRQPWASLRVPMLVAFGVLFAAWAPALVQEATSDQGNLSLIARSEINQERLPTAWDDNRSRLPIGTSLGLVAHQFDVPAPWMGAHDFDQPGWHVATRSAPWGQFVTTAAFGVGVALAHRRRRRRILALQAVAAAAAVGALVAAVSIRGVPYEWLLRPAWIAGFAVWLATGWAVVDAVTGSARIQVRSAITVLSVLVALGVAVVTSTGRFGVSTWEPHSDAVEALTVPTTRAIPRDASVYLWPFGYGTEEGMLVALERVGIRVETQLDRVERPDRFIPIAVVEGNEAIDAFVRDHPGTTLLALYQPDARRLEELGALYQGFAVAVLRAPSLS